MKIILNSIHVHSFPSPIQVWKKREKKRRDRRSVGRYIYVYSRFYRKKRLQFIGVKDKFEMVSVRKEIYGVIVTRRE